MTDASPLCCPACHGALIRDACSDCGTVWGERGGFSALYTEERVTGTDRFMRRIYDGLPSLHDPLTEHLLPRLQRDVSEDQMRSAYLDRLEIDGLEGPIRVLEVGVGTGANLARVQQRMPAADLRYYGMDLSLGMMKHAAERAKHVGFPVELVLGDAHRLPYRDDSFDRVFHVGAIGSFRDPGQALAEMARVARPGAVIVVVDEELDPHRKHRKRDRLAFRMLTFYDPHPGCPTDLLPDGAEVISKTAISRFYYCLAFKMP